MNAFAKRFNDMNVGTKIAAGFAAILIILIAVSATGYFKIAAVGDDLEGYALRVSVVNAVSDIDREFLSYRRAVREVISDKDLAKAAKLAQDEEQRVKSAIEVGIKGIRNPERHAKVEQIKSRFGEYAALAQKAETLREQKEEIGQKVLDADGAKLKADLEDFLKRATRDGNTSLVALGNEALKDILQIQISSNLLLGRQEDTAKADADRAFGDVEAVFASLEPMVSTPEERKEFDGVRMLVSEYRKNYEKAAEIDQQLDEIVGKKLPEVAEIVANDTRSIRRTASAEEETLEHQALDFIHSTEAMMLFSGILGTVLGVLLSWLIGRSISTPIRSIANVLLQLAEGNKSVDVPYGDRRDEVGENARAARIFKENLLRIEQMEAEQKDAERRAAEKRKAEMHRLADEFQSAIGSVVDAVSSASTQLETAAGALTKTASTTQQPPWWPPPRRRRRATSRASQPRRSSCRRP